MPAAFVSYISFTPALAILKCRTYLIMSFALCKDCWSMVCLDLVGWQLEYYVLLFALLTMGVISGHLTFAQVSDQVYQPQRSYEFLARPGSDRSQWVKKLLCQNPMGGWKASIGFLVSQDALWNFAARRGSVVSVASLLGGRQPFGGVNQALEERARLSVIDVETMGIISYWRLSNLLPCQSRLV